MINAGPFIFSKAKAKTDLSSLFEVRRADIALGHFRFHIAHLLGFGPRQNIPYQ